MADTWLWPQGGTKEWKLHHHLIFQPQFWIADSLNVFLSPTVPKFDSFSDTSIQFSRIELMIAFGQFVADLTPRPSLDGPAFQFFFLSHVCLAKTRILTICPLNISSLRWSNFKRKRLSRNSLIRQPKFSALEIGLKGTSLVQTTSSGVWVICGVKLVGSTARVPNWSKKVRTRTKGFSRQFHTHRGDATSYNRSWWTLAWLMFSVVLSILPILDLVGSVWRMNYCGDFLYRVLP